jgi:hypothetical protein
MIGILIHLLMGSSPSEAQAAEDSPLDSEFNTYVMLLNSDCDWDYRDHFEHHMRLSNTQYEKHIDDYSVICLNGIKELSEIEAYTLPTLRQSMPYAKFVFVYPPSMIEQYNDYIDGKYGYQYRYLTLGNTDLPNGIAYVSEVPLNVKHELAHLSLCGTWHDAEGKDIGAIIEHPDANNFSWCASY